MSRSERVVQQLGMSHGAACNRLRKNILFHLLKKLKENVCFKCGDIIELVSDLSIEHKQPWERRDANLFWDIENIAFSHLRCNRQHVYHGGLFRRNVGPEGTAWCGVCKVFHDVSLFHKNASSWNGLQSHCKEHRPDRN